ncbi:MAG TPA: hypothetical protein VJZ00_25010 [Thermoanaerobaculia bacterium]|nr:hypothetical protein [Thermoanaerobaculia bacterium]
MVRTLTVILMLGCATQAVAQANDDAPAQYLLFGGGSENTNNVPYRETLLLKDRKVSPVLSLDSGRGFEFSITRRTTRHLAYTADFSAYQERFTGDAIYCQPTACGTGLHFEDKEQSFHLVAGPEYRGSERLRVTPFARALAGAVFSRSKFTMEGSNVQYFDSYSGTGLILFSTSPFPKTSTVHYADSYNDVGLTLSLGAGLDVRMSESLSARFLMDYDPTFLTRPDIRDLQFAEPTGSTHIQPHIRISLGIVWRF